MISCTQLHNARRERRLQQISSDKKDFHDNSVAKWAERYNKKYYDASRRENEDTMKHAQVGWLFGLIQPPTVTLK